MVNQNEIQSYFSENLGELLQKESLTKEDLIEWRSKNNDIYHELCRLKASTYKDDGFLPTAFWHGSEEDRFDVFAKQNTSYGFFFAPDPMTAGGYGEARPYALRIKNLADLEDPKIFKKIAEDVFFYGGRYVRDEEKVLEWIEDNFTKERLEEPDSALSPIARHSQLEKKYNNGTITEDEINEAEKIVDFISSENGYELTLFHGTDENRESLDGGTFLTDSEQDAAAYAQMKALERAVDESEELSEIVHDVLAEEGGEAITDLGPRAIRDIADANGIDVESPEGHVMKLKVRVENPLDLTEYGSDVGSVKDLWTQLNEIGLLSEKWKDLDRDVRDELTEEYKGKALYRFLEKEGIQAKAFENGYDAVIFTDMSLDGGRSHTSWLIKDSKQIKSASPFTGESLEQRFSKSSLTNDISQIDQDYASAVSRGDMATAQSIIDDACKNSGYSIFLYHGTDKEGALSIVQDGIDMNKSTKGYFGQAFYTTPDADLAKSNYADFSGDGDGSVVRVAMKDTANLIDLRTPEGFEKYNSAKYNGRPLQQLRGFDEFADMAKSAGIDALYDNSFDGWAIYNPDIVVMADPVIYDKQGKLLLPSQRFDSPPENPIDKEYSKAVRKGEFHKAQELMVHAARKAGHEIAWRAVGGDVGAQNSSGGFYATSKKEVAEFFAGSTGTVERVALNLGKTQTVAEDIDGYDSLESFRNAEDEFQDSDFDSIKGVDLPDGPEKSDIFVVKSEDQIIPIDSVSYNNDGSLILPSQQFSQKTSNEAEKSPKIEIDEHGKNIVSRIGDCFVAVDNPKDAKYITLWKNGIRGKIGHLTLTSGRESETRDYAVVASVEIDKKYRGLGLGKEMYLTAQKFVGKQYKGIASENPDRSNNRQVPKIWKSLGAKETSGGGFSLPRIGIMDNEKFDSYSNNVSFLTELQDSGFNINKDGSDYLIEYKDASLNLRIGSPSRWEDVWPDDVFDNEENEIVAVVSAVRVPAEERGKGVGRKLMEIASVIAERDGADNLYLRSSPIMGGSDPTGFYERLGYEQISENTEDDSPIMVKSVNSSVCDEIKIESGKNIYLQFACEVLDLKPEEVAAEDVVDDLKKIINEPEFEDALENHPELFSELEGFAPREKESIKYAREAHESLNQHWYLNYQSDFLKSAESLGYDGVKMLDPSTSDGGESISYVVFCADQIRSVEPLNLNQEGSLIEPKDWNKTEFYCLKDDENEIGYELSERAFNLARNFIGITRDRDVFEIATIDGEIAGVSLLSDSDLTFDVVVHPSYRGKGIGTALTKNAIRELESEKQLQQEAGIEKEIYADVINLRMKTILEKIGWDVRSENEGRFDMSQKKQFPMPNNSIHLCENRHKNQKII